MLQRIGRYEILDRIGGGAFGTVYKARDTVLDRVVAVKVINQPVTDDSGGDNDPSWYTMGKLPF